MKGAFAEQVKIIISWRKVPRESGFYKHSPQNPSASQPGRAAPARVPSPPPLRPIGGLPEELQAPRLPAPSLSAKQVRAGWTFPISDHGCVTSPVLENPSECRGDEDTQPGASLVTPEPPTRSTSRGFHWDSTLAVCVPHIAKKKYISVDRRLKNAHQPLFVAAGFGVRSYEEQILFFFFF